jgi:hypothetical protein
MRSLGRRGREVERGRSKGTGQRMCNMRRELVV